ncbi:MAG: EVE domain-containing protein [Acidobacteriota bacterium]
MNWLVKEEPENYSYGQFLKDRTTIWAGVRNPVAQRHLREMKKGDRVFFYHTGKEKAIIGTATVSKTAYPDPKAENLVVVELAAGKTLTRPVTLKEIKADKRFATMPLVRIARLSVQPVTDDEWALIEEISKHPSTPLRAG